jgi:uncharacterized protein involved in exopolysaccharide biosynthesis
MNPSSTTRDGSPISQGEVSEAGVLESNRRHHLAQDDDEISLLDLLLTVSQNVRLLVLAPIAVCLLSLVITTFFMTPVFTAKTTIMPPVAAGGGGAAALLSSLGGLGLGGLVGGPSVSSKHLAYLDSDSLRLELIKKYNLKNRYQHEFLQQTQESLKKLIKITDDKKTGAISIEFTDEDPKFAAEVANEIVHILRRLLGEDALKVATEQREFFEQQINEAMKKTYQSPQVREAMITGLIRQVEAKRLEEEQPSPAISQVDVAQVPELKSAPKRGLIAVLSSLATGFLLLLFVFVRQAIRNGEQDQDSAEKIGQIKRALRIFPRRGNT